MTALKTLRAFGRDWVIAKFGLHDPGELCVRDTVPCPPPESAPLESAPDSAPAQPVDEGDDFLPPTQPGKVWQK